MGPNDELEILSASAFHKIKSTYLVPTTDKFWAVHQQEVIESFRGHKLVVAGDVRNDSPGFSAQYVSYTMMKEKNRKILTIKTMDKRMTGRKSTALGKAAFQSAIRDLLDHGLTIGKVVTDQHFGIGALMNHRDATEAGRLATSKKNAELTATSKSETAVTAAMKNVNFMAKKNMPT